MSVQLLDKTRKINKLLHNNHSARVEFNDMCAVLSGILESNILVISRKGKVLGTGYYEGVEVISELVYDKVGGFVDEMLNERLLSVLSTKENVNLSTLGFTIENVKKFQALIAPVEIAGERLGTLFMYKSDSSYEIDDIILSEYGTTVVGLEMMRSVNEETAEESRKKKIVRSAIDTLSTSELDAIKSIFKELDGGLSVIDNLKVAGAKEGKYGVAVIVSENSDASAVFTSNKIVAAPVIYTKKVVEKGKVSAVFVNSGNANCFTGNQGIEDCESLVELVSKELNIPKGEIAISSTVVIVRKMPLDVITGVASKVFSSL